MCRSWPASSSTTCPTSAAAKSQRISAGESSSERPASRPATAAVASVDDVQRLMVSDVIGVAVRVRVVREGRPVTVDLVPAELE